MINYYLLYLQTSHFAYIQKFRKLVCQFVHSLITIYLSSLVFKAILFLHRFVFGIIIWRHHHHLFTLLILTNCLILLRLQIVPEEFLEPGVLEDLFDWYARLLRLVKHSINQFAGFPRHITPQFLIFKVKLLLDNIA